MLLLDFGGELAIFPGGFQSLACLVIRFNWPCEGDQWLKVKRFFGFVFTLKVTKTRNFKCFSTREID